MSTYHWVCKGCLVGAGQDLNNITESCIGRFGKVECAICHHTQDHSWFHHMLPRDMPEALQAKLVEEEARLAEEEQHDHDSQMLYPEDYGG